MKYKKGDEVKISIGKDKGKTGKIEKVLPKKEAVIVTGLNMYKRHYKPRKQGEQGGIIDIIKPIAIAKIALICPKCKSQTRIGFSTADGKKVRICRKCKQEV